MDYIWLHSSYVRMYIRVSPKEYVAIAFAYVAQNCMFHVFLHAS